MKTRILTALVLTAALLLAACAPAAPEETGTPSETPAPSAVSGQFRDLMAAVSPRTVETRSFDSAFRASQLSFALGLLQDRIQKDEGNLLLSPLSVMVALAMTANGASGKTLSEMEAVLGGGIPIDELNAYLKGWLGSLPSSSKARFAFADSLWIRAGVEGAVEPDFLQTNADYYGADAYVSPFDDSGVREINAWVNRKTDEMIPELIDSIQANVVMILLNAIAFDALWAEQYDEDHISTFDFCDASGKTSSVSMLCSSEKVYLEDDLATGFLKAYQDPRYAFVALLPKEGTSLEDYVAALTPERFSSLLAGRENTSVSARLPQFSYDYTASLVDTLSAMGMPDAFGGDYDFSRMMPDVWIDEVLHKTFIEVTPAGTRAAAVTAVMMRNKAVHVDEKEVILDRPFLYMIIDTGNDLPLFIGTVTSVGN